MGNIVKREVSLCSKRNLCRCKGAEEEQLACPEWCAVRRGIIESLQRMG